MTAHERARAQRCCRCGLHSEHKGGAPSGLTYGCVVRSSTRDPMLTSVAPGADRVGAYFMLALSVRHMLAHAHACATGHNTAVGQGGGGALRSRRNVFSVGTRSTQPMSSVRRPSSTISQKK